MSNKKFLDAIDWHEGMLLMPQHFQVSSSRSEELAVFHGHASNPYSYGVSHIMIDKASMQDGTFRVEELEAILPDGLRVTVSNGDPDLSVSLADNKNEIETLERTL